MLQVDWDSYVAFPNTAEELIGATCIKCGTEICTCRQGIKPDPFKVRSSHGWICPRCDSVYGPTIQECTRCNPPHEFKATF